MGTLSTVMFVSGPPGSGKTYWRCARFLVREFLPNSEGVHVSNFPVKLEPWTDGAGVEHPGLVGVLGESLAVDLDATARVKRFAPEEVERWRNQDRQRGAPVFGPWDVLADQDISGWHIAIDEIHVYCPAGCDRAISAAWSNWLGEIRHRGATVEFLSQHEKKVHKVIHQHAAIRVELIPGEEMRDPVLGIRCYYWFNLLAKLTGRWSPGVWCHEYRQQGGKWILEHQELFRFEKQLFGVYDSFSAPSTGGIAGHTGRKEYEFMGWPQLLFWFAVGNSTALITRGGWVLVAFVAYLFRKPLTSLFWGFFMSGGFGMVKMGTPGVAPPAAVEQGRAGGAAQPVSFGRPQDGGLLRVDGQTLQTGEAIADYVNQLQDELDELHGETVALKSRLGEFEAAEKLRTELVGLSETHAWLADGQTAAVGQRLVDGPHAGRTVRSIEVNRRLCTLDDGTVLRLRLGYVHVRAVPGEVEGHAADVAPLGAPVPGPLRRDPKPDGQPTPAPRPPGKNSDVVSGLDAAGASSPGAMRSVLRLNRDGGDSRPPPGDGGAAKRSLR